MCGFAGIIHWDQEPVPEEDLKEACLRLKHRGPDEQGIVALPEGAGLAHARLRVVDLSDAARQPMASPSGALWLLYNGEIYNFREIRAQLEAEGFRFRSHSDTEVLLKAYEAWGTKAFERIDGMFSATLWDSVHRELILVRDRVGKKPLFYWTDGRCLAFGSEIKALWAHRHVPREVEESVLPFLLAFGYPPMGKSCYRRIQEVPPATFLRFKAGQKEPAAERFWQLRFDGPGQRIGEREAVHRLRHLLGEAVRRRLYADVPLGAFLSGGLDSTLVVGLMTRFLKGRPVKTFSIGFEGDRRFNETGYARIAAERFRTEHTVFLVTPQSFDLLERLVWHYDQPFGDSSAIPTYLLAQLTREQVTVALTGDGGDELFAGYDRFRAALWAERLPGSLRTGLGKIAGLFPSGSERAPAARIRRFCAAAGRPPLERYLQWIRYGDLSDAKAQELAEYWKQSVGWSDLARLLHLNFHSYLPGDLLVKTDRCSMAHGLELRCPFLDTALLEYAASLPDRFKASLWESKILLRRAFPDLLPEAIRSRRKMGFGVPLGSWFRKQWRQPLLDLLGSPSAKVRRYVEREKIQAMIADHLQGRRDAGHPLWLLLTLEVWLKQLERSPHEAAVG